MTHQESEELSTPYTSDIEDDGDGSIISENSQYGNAVKIIKMDNGYYKLLKIVKQTMGGDIKTTNYIYSTPVKKSSTKNPQTANPAIGKISDSEQKEILKRLSGMKEKDNINKKDNSKDVVDTAKPLTDKELERKLRVPQYQYRKDTAKKK
jgi:hypothetical protein